MTNSTISTNLIEINQTKVDGELIQTVNARDLHKFLEVTTRFNDWVSNRIRDFGFEEDIDFSIFTENLVKGRPAKQYAISIDMAKELSMVERNDKGKEARQYFIQCEKVAKQPTQIDYSSPEAIIGVITAQGEKIEKLNQQVEAQVIQIEQSKPKVNFYDQYLNADGLYGLQNAARALQCKPNLFIRWLKSKYLFYQGGNLVAKVQYTSMGLFEVKSTIVDDKARPQTYITPKGIEYLDNRVPNELRINQSCRQAVGQA